MSTTEKIQRTKQSFSVLSKELKRRMARCVNYGGEEDEFSKKLLKAMGDATELLNEMEGRENELAQLKSEMDETTKHFERRLEIEKANYANLYKLKDEHEKRMFHEGQKMRELEEVNRRLVKIIENLSELAVKDKRDSSHSSYTTW